MGTIYNMDLAEVLADGVGWPHDLDMARALVRERGELVVLMRGEDVNVYTPSHDWYEAALVDGMVDLYRDCEYLGAASWDGERTGSQVDIPDDVRAAIEKALALLT